MNLKEWNSIMHNVSKSGLDLIRNPNKKRIDIQEGNYIIKLYLVNEYTPLRIDICKSPKLFSLKP